MIYHMMVRNDAGRVSTMTLAGDGAVITGSAEDVRETAAVMVNHLVCGEIGRVTYVGTVLICDAVSALQDADEIPARQIAEWVLAFLPKNLRDDPDDSHTKHKVQQFATVLGPDWANVLVDFAKLVQAHT